MRRRCAYVLLVASTLFVPALPAGAEPRAPLAAGGCWMVLPKGEKPERGNAAEVLCLRRDGYGRVRESSFYGDVAGCGRVTYRTSNGPTLVEIDFSACTNGAPNHSLLCASGSGRNPVPCLQRVPGDDEPVEMELYPLDGAGS
ncbi:MAG TPA: hypothetical protein VGN91_24965 [Bosea sp. (in: a-proteobacteria)]|jgi:hypothetical protein|uniref:hypothetical protein n=1 Tax=Bosea sp. CRIB-10 TaxID=378404 RepID=UPI0008F395C1|nr:hypothetical protein [Bosea sp. CRIB-10]SFD46784.1 hypothetical protein SAMN05428997_12943 [Bosea sp. CRIB-10]HEV7328324.1 hypothetical protein [Bosea sp. (in: a-proteobacteria)]